MKKKDLNWTTLIIAMPFSLGVVIASMVWVVFIGFHDWDHSVCPTPTPTPEFEYHNTSTPDPHDQWCFYHPLSKRCTEFCTRHDCKE